MSCSFLARAARVKALTSNALKERLGTGRIAFIIVLMIPQIILDAYSWMKANDLPNWVILLFTAIAWPIVLFIFQKRAVNNIPGLEVRFEPGRITISDHSYPAVAIDFINHTGSVVYLTSAGIRRCSRLFLVPISAGRDIARGLHHLSFLGQKGQFNERELTLQTNASTRTAIAVYSEIATSFYKYRAPWYKRLLRVRKYFVLEYVAMVGNKRYSVSTLY